MCLTVERNAKRQKATEDITVYKVLKKVKGRTYDATSIFRRGTKWYRGKVKRASRLGEPEYDFNFRCSAVNEGLHAFMQIGNAEGYCIGYAVETVVMMTIPKGSGYYISSDGDEIAATRMYWPPE